MDNRTTKTDKHSDIDVESKTTNKTNYKIKTEKNDKGKDDYIKEQGSGYVAYFSMLYSPNIWFLSQSDTAHFLEYPLMFL